MKNVTQTLDDAIEALRAAGLSVEPQGSSALVYEPEARHRGACLVIEGGYRDSGRGIASYVLERENRKASGAFRERVRGVLAADLGRRGES